jgi:acetyl esterase/lipase
VCRVAEVQLRGPTGPLAARAYWPPPRDPVTAPPLVVLFPGVGGLDPVDPLCRSICAQLGPVVLSVSCRSRAPEHRAAALEDATAAVQWAADHAAELGADPGRLLVAGVGTGAGLAAGVARRARDDGWPPICRQVSVQPGTAAGMLHDLARSLRPALDAT